MQKRKRFTGLISFALLPLAASAQIYQDASNTTATVVRDPARQASIETDAVIYNPAGTAFLDEGWHLSLNGNFAHRSFNLSDNYYNVEKSIGNSIVDYIPSVQAAYKRGALSLSLSVGNEGGYGKFITTEDAILSNLLTNVNRPLFDSYKSLMSGFTNSCGQYDQLVSKALIGGDLYNYSFRVGAAYQINPHWSVYAGLRFNYATEKTFIDITQWVATPTGAKTINDYFGAVNNDFQNSMQEIGQQYEMLAELCNILGLDASNFQDVVNLSKALGSLVDEYNKKIAETPYHTNLINERTNGWGISPVIGLDYKVGKFNFAAKYEFETKIHPTSNSLSYHIPGVLSLGASYDVKDNLKVSIGGSLHHQNYSSLYGGDQRIDLSDENLYFNMTRNPSVGVSINTVNHSSIVEYGDISASISFSPQKKLMFSVGYMHSFLGPVYLKSVFPQSRPIEQNQSVKVNAFSGGLRYDISNKVQLNLGISKEIGMNGFYSTSNSVSEIRGLNMSAGININM